MKLPKPHPCQCEFIESKAKRKIIRAGRRGGKTVGAAILTVQNFLKGRRELYAAPTQEQIDRYWVTVCRALYEPIKAGVFHKNETRHIIERPRTEQRIRAKTAWNADTLRGDYADDLILDEFQLMNEDAWQLVGAPMLLDNNGNAIFIYTPPSLRSRSASKANDPQHAAKLFKRAIQDKTGRWKAFHFSSHANPHLNRQALDEISQDMTEISRRMEIEAEDIDEAPGALWTRGIIESNRVPENLEYELDRIVIGVDPTGSSAGDEAGIVAAGRAANQFYVLEDRSCHGRPEQWASAVIGCFEDLQADCIVAEINFGGEMVESTIKNVSDGAHYKYKPVSASRGKAVRAEPIAAFYEKGRVHHIGAFPRLEDEQCLWVPGDKSPNRMDALVWALTELSTGFIRAKGDIGIS